MKPRKIVSVIVLTLALISTGCAAQAQRIEFRPAQDRIDVLVGSQIITSYMYGGPLTKPVLYPIKTPGGTTVNRGFPLTKVEGETDDHPHHIGIFCTYDEVGGNSFWNNTTTPPQIKHIKVVANEPGDGRGKLATLSDWIAKDGRTVVLEENRTMLFQTGKDCYTIDFTIDLTAKQKVEFGDTKEGMFAIRTADWMREKGGSGRYFSSEGTEGSGKIWGRRARWVALEAKKDDKAVGIAILNHPSSVNYPTFWHARDYGLFSANPLGQEAFEKANKVEKPTALHLTLEPGQTTKLRFLVMIYEGPRTKDQIESQFKAFAK